MSSSSVPAATDSPPRTIWRAAGITNIAVLDKGYLAGGNTARNTTIIRANYLTPEGVAFYKESVELFRTLSTELDINLMYSERGHFTLAHTDAAMRTARWRAEVNKHLGVDSEVIDWREVARICPLLNMSRDVHHPSSARSGTRPARSTGMMRWPGAMRKEAMRLGVDIFPQTEVTGIRIEHGRAVGVRPIAASFMLAGSYRRSLAHHPMS